MFLLYDYTGFDEEGFTMSLDRVVATNHDSLMMGTLYRATPPKADFEAKIIHRLKSS